MLRKYFTLPNIIVAALTVLIGMALFTPHAPLAINPFTMDDVVRLLGTFAVLALVVERTIEVSIGAWRGESAERLSTTAESAKLVLISSPSSVALQELVAATDMRLTEHRVTTRKIAIRAAVLMGMLISFTGLSTFEVLLSVPAGGTLKALFSGLDTLITAAIIGGGSEPIHKMISVVTSYLDAASSLSHARETQANRSSVQSPIVTLPPPLTPGQPA